MTDCELQIDSIATQSLVCEACWGNLFTFHAFQAARSTEDNPGSRGFSYTTSWEVIRSSIAQGCNWCNLLSRPAQKSFGECPIRVSFSKETEAYTPAGVKKLEIVYGGKTGSSGEISYRFYTNGDDNASKIIRQRDRVLQVSAPSSYKLALECLERCIQSHDQCPNPPESSLPDRVIDCSNLERPKLFVANNIPGIYATLSYVWGQNQNLVTTTASIDSFIKDGIDMQLFPPTIQHALISAHNLGMRYLWIDALCIIQDSTEDKGRQIGKMNQIYRNAYITIIAACADGVDEGFLQDRPARIPSAHIPFICPDGKVGTVYLTSASEVVGYDVTQMYHDELEPVHSRGWCLQERVLSERSFIFASDTLKYQCQTETVNIGDAFCEPSTGPRLPKAFASGYPSLSPEERLWARRSWLYIIWEYSRRSLTRPDEDKLNALAGVAEQYYHLWNSKYYAGLWERTMLEDLLWRRSTVGKASTRSPHYRAPSWSWASIDSHVDAPNFESKLQPGKYDVAQCTVIECSVAPVREDAPFAAVSAAHLKLDSFIHGAVLEKGDSTASNWKVFLATDASRPGRHVGWVKMDSVEDIVEITQAWIVPILWDRGLSWVEALVVAAAGNGFRRLGYFSAERGLDWLQDGNKRVITMI